MISDRIKGLRSYKTETSEAKVKLSSNELPYDLPEDLKKRVSEEIKKIPLNRYPDPSCGELKEVLADFLDIKPENAVLGNGSDELIYYLSVAVGEPDQAVYIPVPTFPMYEISADVFGRPKAVVELESGFDIDIYKSLKVVEEIGVVIAYYAYPNNPTGNLFSREKILKIRERGVFTVVDEAYFHYSKESFIEEALTRDDTVVLRTLSKIGLAGLRIGILIAREEVAREIEKMRLPFNITYPSQVIARVVLTEGRYFIEDTIRSVLKEREKLFDEMSKIEGVEVFPSKANFLLFRTPFEAKRLHSELLRRGVLVRDMSYLPGLDRCLRVSVGKPTENEIFLEALEDSLQFLTTSEKST